MFLRNKNTNKAQIISPNVKKCICLCKTTTLLRDLHNFFSKLELDPGLPLHEVWEMLASAVFFSLIFLWMFSCELTVKTVIRKSFWIAVAKSTLWLFYGNNESMQIAETTSGLNFHYEKAGESFGLS